MNNPFKKGDRIKLKVPLNSGWKGKGTVVYAKSYAVGFIKDEHPRKTGQQRTDLCWVCHWECFKIRNKHKPKGKKPCKV